VHLKEAGQVTHILPCFFALVAAQRVDDARVRGLVYVYQTTLVIIRRLVVVRFLSFHRLVYLVRDHKGVGGFVAAPDAAADEGFFAFAFHKLLNGDAGVGASNGLEALLEGVGVEKFDIAAE
jgi:hypothetical protein